MQKLPVGLSDFKEVIEGNYYFADKSLLIKELIDQGAKVLLIPRPRRFGKTLNLSMLRYFFEKPALPTALGRPGTAADTSGLFRHLKIWQAGEEYTGKQGKYPVIFLTFKDVEEANWESVLERIKRLIQAEFVRHQYLREDKGLSIEDDKYFEKIVALSAGEGEYQSALKHLSHYLARYHQQQVIVLVDEYDAPFQAGYVHGYYHQAAEFMLGLLGAILKDNSDLEKGVLTGRLWPAMDSRLNNLAVYTLLRHGFEDKFGLTEPEARQMLKDFDAEAQYQTVKEWYNGYLFVDTAIYNPWSIIHYLQNPGEGFKPYWLNSSDVAIVAQLLTEGGTILKPDLESLINGESIEKRLDEIVVLGEMARRDDQLWSFLLCNGYLRYEAEHRNDFDPNQISYQLAIPNQEVRSIYVDIVQQWFASRMENGKPGMMLQAFVAGEIKEIERLLRELVENIYRNHDLRKESERVYQAFVTGLLVWLGGDYELKSNRESGYGRYDLMIIPKNKAQIGYVIEFKKVSAYENETVEQAVANAFAQIETKGYETELRQRDVKTIKKLAIVFKGKQVWVKEQSA